MSIIISGNPQQLTQQKPSQTVLSVVLVLGGKSTKIIKFEPTAQEMNKISV